MALCGFDIAMQKRTFAGKLPVRLRSAEINPNTGITYGDKRKLAPQMVHSGVYEDNTLNQEREAN